MRLLAQADGHEDFWPAYTDILMVTCLVMVLLAATFALTHQDDRVKEELKRRKEAFSTDFGRTMGVEIKHHQVQLVSPPGERQTISFSDHLLFDKGDAALKHREGRAALTKLAGLFKRHLGAEPLFQRIQVNGHTDEDAIKTAEFPSNWHLSSARATSVVYFLVNQGIQPERLTATGYAQYHPFDPLHRKITAKAKKRRIEIVLLYPADWISGQLGRATAQAHSKAVD